MPNDNGGITPTGNADGNPPPPPIPTVEERLIALEAESRANREKYESDKFWQKVTAGESWLIRIGAATLIVNIAIAYIYFSQLRQMTLATQASTNAANTATEALEESGGQFERTVKQLIYQTVSQAQSAKATQRAAGAAQSAATTADKTLHVSERAYVVLGVPQHDFANKLINIPVINSGHIPSGPVTITLHVIVFRIANPEIEKTVPVTPDSLIEKHWITTTYQSIPPGSNEYSVAARIHRANPDQINSGKMGIAVGALVTYNDGFPDTPNQTWVFCDEMGYSADMKTGSMQPCPDPNGVLKSLMVVDDYPNPQTEDH